MRALARIIRTGSHTADVAGDDAPFTVTIARHLRRRWSTTVPPSLQGVRKRRRVSRNTRCVSSLRPRDRRRPPVDRAARDLIVRFDEATSNEAPKRDTVSHSRIRHSTSAAWRLRVSFHLELTAPGVSVGQVHPHNGSARCRGARPNRRPREKRELDGGGESKCAPTTVAASSLVGDHARWCRKALTGFVSSANATARVATLFSLRGRPGGGKKGGGKVYRRQRGKGESHSRAGGRVPPRTLEEDCEVSREITGRGR